MRHWIFHPFIFYPAILLIAAGVVVLSLGPPAWPRAAVPQAGEIADGVLTLEGGAFTAPDKSPEQQMYVVRDLWGNAQALRVAVLPNQPPPTPAEQGVRVLLAPEAAALIDDKPVVVEITYRPVPINAASGLAVSLQGIGPADWVIQPLAPEAGTLSFTLPPAFGVNAIGLRAITEGQDQAYGVEIIRIRATPGA